MRQEKMINHFMEAIHSILRRENSQIYLRNMNFFILNQSTAMIEFVENSTSISCLKKLYPE